jgi:hypothetical protein
MMLPNVANLGSEQDGMVAPSPDGVAMFPIYTFATSTRAIPMQTIICRIAIAAIRSMIYDNEQKVGT